MQKKIALKTTITIGYKIKRNPTMNLGNSNFESRKSIVIVETTAIMKNNIKPSTIS
jgi:hypothetical protein